MTDLNSFLTPGTLVQVPDHPEWGTGQVQSNIAGKITVTFPDEGKLVFDSHRIALLPVVDP